MQNLEDVLSHYHIKGKIGQVIQGPLVNVMEFYPAPGTKVKTIATALEDIAREMNVPSLRIENSEETGAVNFEFPAEKMKIVDFEALISSTEFLATDSKLPIILGVDVFGRPLIADLAKMPHLLVAGTTGSGKSVGLNSFILSLMARLKPADLKFVLIDPKRIEFSVYNNQRYMLAPVVTETAEAATVLTFLTEEMEKRYALFEENLVKNISEYNEQAGHLPYIVCIIDEFADLMSVEKSVEASVRRLAQKARAAGIHIILATQRPSVDVVTGVLKANFPTRLSYKTASLADSRTILDAAGAEKLLGRGDALFLAANGNLKRVHGAYMPDEKIADFLEPFRCKTSPLPQLKKEVSVEVVSKQPVKKTEKSMCRKLWDFWVNLRQKDKKIIINAIVFLFNFLTKRRR